MTRLVYTVEGSEDGLLGVYGSAKAAFNRVHQYFGWADDPKAPHLAAFRAEIRRGTLAIVTVDGPEGMSATVRAFEM